MLHKCNLSECKVASKSQTASSFGVWMVHSCSVEDFSEFYAFNWWTKKWKEWTDRLTPHHWRPGGQFARLFFFFFKFSQHFRGAHLHQSDVTHFVSLSNFDTAEESSPLRAQQAMCAFSLISLSFITKLKLLHRSCSLQLHHSYWNACETCSVIHFRTFSHTPQFVPPCCVRDNPHHEWTSVFHQFKLDHTHTHTQTDCHVRLLDVFTHLLTPDHH